MMKTDYPVRIRCSESAIDEFRQCECGRWEDHGCGLHNGPSCEGDANDCGPMAYDILGRCKTVIEIRDQAEAEEVYWAVGTGTFQVDYLRTARRIADALTDYVDHSKWHIAKAYPDGY